MSHLTRCHVAARMLAGLSIWASFQARLVAGLVENITYLNFERRVYGSGLNVILLQGKMVYRSEVKRESRSDAKLRWWDLEKEFKYSPRVIIANMDCSGNNGFYCQMPWSADPRKIYDASPYVIKGYERRFSTIGNHTPHAIGVDPDQHGLVLGDIAYKFIREILRNALSVDCDPDTFAECDEKEQKYAIKWNEKAQKDRQALVDETKRLQAMADAPDPESMPEVGNQALWVVQRARILQTIYKRLVHSIYKEEPEVDRRSRLVAAGMEVENLDDGSEEEEEEEEEEDIDGEPRKKGPSEWKKELAYEERKVTARAEATLHSQRQYKKDPRYDWDSTGMRQNAHSEL